MRSFFACSVGQPTKEYDEENLNRIINSKAFVLHEDTNQKGVYDDIKPGDILLLKYRKKFVAYGETSGKQTTNDDEWNLTAPVIEWHFMDINNPEIGVGTYGIQWSTLEGAGQMGTVKELDETFGLEKIRKIDDQSILFKNILKQINRRKNMQQIIDIANLLKNKHQIILQGPPGTGKTRKAKELAFDLCKPKEITKEDINKILKVGIKIPSSTNYTNYKISGVNSNSISVKLENNSVYNPSISNIIEAYKNKLWLGGQVGGNHPYEAAIAMYIFEHYPIHDYFKIVQFHPSYSYEDFVRGISVKTVNGHPSYETENRTLMKFANVALENYLNSKKPSAELSKEKWVASELNIFAESISEKLANEELFELTDKVNIIDIQDDAFIYTGNTWQAVNGHRMKFTDIIKAYLQNAGTRPEYQNVLGISGRAFQHASYDFKLLVKFKDFLKTRPEFIETTIKSDLKNYVLIIDEINRANLASVLGELIYALEYRNESVESLYELEGGDKKLILPPNLKIIGTMNTADRSVGHIDYAIRRRFAFVDVLPEIEPVHQTVIDKFKSVASLFVNNFDAGSDNWIRSEHMASDFQPHEVMIGHSYFICKKDGINDDEDDAKAKGILDLKMEFEVVPILKEYIKDGILNDTPEVKAIIHGLIP
jgi:DNA polymerase III delta prime subunit